MTQKVGLKDGKLYIIFPPSTRMSLRVKGLQGKIRHRQPVPHWRAQATPENIKKLEEWGFVLSPQVAKFLETPAAPVIPHKHLDLSFLNGTPYEYQREAMAYGQEKNFNLLLADDMGLGKTVEAIGCLGLLPAARPALVVPTANIKLKWAAMIKEWLGAGERVHVINGMWDKKSPLPAADIYIANYDIIPHIIPTACKECGGTKKKEIRSQKGVVLRAIKCPECKGTGKGKPIIKARNDLAQIPFEIIILDECQALKNWKTQRTKAVLKIAKKCAHKIAISGTPILNRPIEFYTVLSLLAPKLFANYRQFTFKWCDAKSNGFGMDVNGASNTTELHALLVKTCMIRRTKDQVLTQLPPKRRDMVPIEITNRKEYKEAEQNFLGWLRNTKGTASAKAASQAVGVTKINYLKQLAARGKMDAVVGWLDDFLATEEKVVVACDHKEIVNILMERLAAYRPAKIDGSVSPTKRPQTIAKFQDDPKVRIIILTKAGCEGIDCTAAANTVTIEFWWEPGKHLQLEDRVHRIGQEAESVGAYYLYAAGTIEEDIAGIINKKMKTLAAVLDGKEIDTETVLMNLVHTLEERK